MRIIYLTRDAAHYLNSVCCQQARKMRENGQDDTLEYAACIEYISDYATACMDRARQPDDD